MHELASKIQGKWQWKSVADNQAVKPNTNADRANNAKVAGRTPGKPITNGRAQVYGYRRCRHHRRRHRHDGEIQTSMPTNMGLHTDTRWDVDNQHRNERPCLREKGCTLNDTTDRKSIIYRNQ
jgi:hypothetical protein